LADDGAQRSVEVSRFRTEGGVAEALGEAVESTMSAKRMTAVPGCAARPTWEEVLDPDGVGRSPATRGSIPRKNPPAIRTTSIPGISTDRVSTNARRAFGMAAARLRAPSTGKYAFAAGWITSVGHKMSGSSGDTSHCRVAAM